MTTRFSRRALACALLATTALSASAIPSAAYAQSVPTAPPPLHSTVDPNGVDLVSGKFRFGITEAAIGSGEGGISLERIWGDGAFRDNWSSGLYVGSDGRTYVEFGDVSDVFTQSGSTYTSVKGDGATLTGSGGSFLYTAADGTQVTFDNGGSAFPLQGYSCPDTSVGACAIPSQITKPNGMKFTLNWGVETKCTNQPDCDTGIGFYRFEGVTSSAGYGFTVTYLTDFPGNLNNLGAPRSDWYKKTGVTFSNSATACDSSCGSLTYADLGAGVTTVTDALSRTWRFNAPSTGITGIRRPGETSDSTTIGYAFGGVTSVTKDGVTTTYSRTVSGNVSTVVVTDALSHAKTIVGDIAKHRITSIQDELGRTTSFQYDSSGRLTRTTFPEGNYVQLTYDARGNVTETRRVAKSGSGLADIVSTASFDTTCSNIVKCNQPNSSTDARGNTSNYTYDSTHGGVTAVTQPAPTVGAVRPEVRASYTQVTSASGDLVYMLTGTSACQTTASCSGGSDETKASASYNSNLLPTSVSSGNGTGTLTASSAMTYDPAGNLLTTDGPLSGTADTTRFRYDAARRQIGTTSPDPDGAGSLKMRATRTTYRPDSQVSKQELGNVNSQSDADWALFTTAQTVDIGFDSNARPVTSKLSAGGTDYALTQTSYDALGRAECSAVRMNTAIYGSLPASACSLGTAGSFGADRIGKTIRDAAGQVTQLKVAFGTGDEANERTLTYSSNGQLATLKDAENNLTTYEYDGHDRLLKTRLPDTTKGAGTSSTTDYEQLGYDANSNVVSRRLRDGNSIAFTFDNLNRPTLKDLPGTEPDVTFGYDNLGRLTSASQTGNALAFTYDALSRNLTQVGQQGTVTSEWDLAGRRTKITYPGSGLFVNYDYLVTGEVQKIRENNASSGVGVLATFGYDDLGRRTSLTFGNGAAQSYSFDAVSRLASLTANLSGTANDLTIGSMSYNPASQIVSQNRSNDAYAWTGHGSGSTASVANGLNQLTSIGGSATTHDARGNLTSDPTTGKTYSYSSENLLTGASGGVTLAYDPQLRLYQVAGAATTRFAYDGVNALAEYNASNALQRRFVFGPSIDEPLIQYEGSGTTDRRFLHADERGSIVAVSDGTGAMLNINKYDEFGKPQSTNSGRFQYTGQMWLPEVGLYYYKARMYAPHLPRFLQTDPIGGTNLYAAMGGDAINSTDPGGTFERTSQQNPLFENDYNGQSNSVHGGQRSYDNMGQIGTHVSGRLDELVNLPLFLATASLAELSLVTLAGGGPSVCVKYCTRAQGNGIDILIQPNPVYGQIQLAAGPRPPKIFLPPTNPPQYPPKYLPPGHTRRFMPPNALYPDGYWREYNAKGQAIDISTGKPPSNVSTPESMARTHVPFPPANPTPVLPWWIRLSPLGVLLYGLGIVAPDPLY
jgi:RHS repeat-associated protein